MTRKRVLLTLAGLLGSVALWIALASLAYAYIASVPVNCWFYYAIPWPDRWLWDGVDLVLSGSLATVPFIVAGQLWGQRLAKGKPIYGKTALASKKDMEANRISTIR